MSIIQVDSITNAAGTGSPTFPNGVTVTLGGVGGLGAGGVVTPGAYPFTLTNAHKNMVVLVDTTAARTVTLPAHSTGYVITIKDFTGSAAANNITLVRNAAGNIEGVAASMVLDQDRITVTYISDGTNWHMVA